MPAPASSFVDLSRLAPPTIVKQLKYGTRHPDCRVQAQLPSFDATVDSDPAVKVLQIAVYEQMILRADFNDRLQQRLLASTTCRTVPRVSPRAARPASPRVSLGVPLFSAARGVMTALCPEPARFNEIKRRLDGITHKSLV